MPRWEGTSLAAYYSCISIGILLRALIGLHSYSGKEVFLCHCKVKIEKLKKFRSEQRHGVPEGQAKPPLYGDYEAQRHWMEITAHLNASDW